MGWSDYVKIKKIGEGAFGAAFLVKCNKDNKQYVIKQINVSRMPTKEREEAKKEVAVLAQMKHPNIVSYIDSFEEGGNLCIVMDYCDGGDLYTKIHSMRGIPISEDQIVDWFVQITLALKHVHDRKILHRDLKSQNIFLTKDGTIKLGDFGVAKVLSNTMELARTAIGTPYYMSPEICEHKPYNNKSDVWSLGCVLYELTNMRHPFEANNLQMLICKILRGNFDQVNPKYSYELRNLVACMLKRNPRERPSVNGILRKPFIMKKCEKFLTNEKLIEEFSHTVLHGENFKNKIQNQNLVNKPSAVKVNSRPSSAVAATPIVYAAPNGGIVVPPRQVYDPSKIYKAPVVRRPSPGVNLVQKSIEKKNVDIRKRPPSADRESVEKLSFLEEQRQKKKIQEEALLRKKQMELLEKQKQDRMNKAREAGWQNVLSGSDLFEEDKENNIKNDKIDPYPFVNNQRGSGTPIANDHNIYVRYHKKFDEIRKRSDEIQNRLANPSPSPLPNFRPSPSPAARQNSNKIKAINKNIVVDEYLKRKEEFLRNKARGKSLFNNPLAAKPPLIKKDEKSLYEENLKKIRDQNYLKRKVVCNQKSKEKNIQRNSVDRQMADNRLKKIESLKQQSEEQIRKIKKDLEKKQLEAYEKEKQNIDKKPSNEPIISKDLKPATQVHLTEVFSAIGVIGKQISKEEVLKNLNEKYLKENRKVWQNGTNLAELENRTLIDQTVVNNTSNKKIKPEILSPRKIWDSPHETVIKALEIADLSTVSGNLKENKDKKGETFVIGKLSDNSNDEMTNSNSSSNLNLLINEKPPELFNKLDIFKNTLKLLTPEKIATLKATKNLLLEVTLGQFDPKNTKMLRTCSEPDMNKLFDIEDNLKENKDKINNLNKIKDSTQNLEAYRLTKSLEEINDDQEKLSDSDNNSELDSLKEEQDLIELIAITEKKNKIQVIAADNCEYDDLNEVRNNMESILLDNEEDSETSSTNTRKNVDNPQKKIVSFASGNRLVAALSIKDCETPLDSLEISRKNSNQIDVHDSENVLLNGEEDNDSDTEFEDFQMPMPLDAKLVSSSYHSIEEKRAYLEKRLGAERFIKGYPSLHSIIINEEESPKLKNKKDKKSFELFFKLFPEAEQCLYDDVRDLIIADMEFNEN